jgi:hypothetical protein
MLLHTTNTAEMLPSVNPTNANTTGAPRSDARRAHFRHPAIKMMGKLTQITVAKTHETNAMGIL